MTKSRTYDPLLPWLNTGLLTSSGKITFMFLCTAIKLRIAGRKWHARRKLLTPSFHFNILQQFVDVFGKQTELLVQDLEQFCEKEEFNILPLIGKFTLRAVCGG